MLFEIDGLKLEVPDTLLNQKLSQKFQNGQYEQLEARAAKIRVKPGQRVLELGSGVGYISSICAQITDPSNIVTVEANPAMLDVIHHNLSLNNASGVTLVHGAVAGESDDDGPVLFRVGNAFWGASLADTDSKPEHVVAVSKVKFRDLLNTHTPHVVIMDIEGAEQFLFDTPWPKHVRQVIMELHPKRYPMSTIKKIVDCMSQSGLTYDTRVSQGTLLGFKKVR